MAQVSIRGFGPTGESQTVQVRFFADQPSQLLNRLLQVASAMQLPPEHDATDPRLLITEVRTEVGHGAIVVSAITPLRMTGEELQARLLALVPPA